MTLKETAIKYHAEILLGAILLLSAFLNFWNVWNGGISNAYYASAVRSTLVNPVAGFFNSLDPAGFITVDKPPVGLWVQALFAAVLGFSGWTIILPQALAGIGSVALIYFIISRPFGKPAGLVAAFALAVTPISVAVARNGTMDMQMIFVILLAVWAGLKAARERSLLWLVASAVLVGIGFNIKMIQAFIVVPAILTVYFLGATDLAWKKRVLHVGLAVVLLLAISLSWALVVDSIPAEQRPFIGGSDDNTVMGLIINYNGAHRLGIGDSGGGPGGSSGSSGERLSAQGAGNRTMAVQGGASPSFQGPGGSPFAGPQSSQGTSGGSSGAPAGGMGGGGGMYSGGSAGVFRIFQNDLAGDIAWLLMFALIGVLAWVRKPRAFSIESIREAGYLGDKGLTLIVMLLWLIPGLLYFSFTSGFWHDYYIATIAPPLAALIGIGAAGMYREYVGGSLAGWLLVIAVPVTGILQAVFLSSDTGFAGSLVPIILAGTIACAGSLALIKVRKVEVLENHRLPIAAVAIAILFIAPLVWSCTLLPGGNSGNLPTASLSGGSRGGIGGGGPGGSMSGGPASSGMGGPGNTGSFGPANSSSAGNRDGLQEPPMARNGTRLPDRDVTSRSGMETGTPGFTPMGEFPGNQTADGSAINGGPGGMGGSKVSTSRLAEYLVAHTTGETWILAVPSSHDGADLIIQTGKPVMCLGGFTGSDQFLNVTMLRRYIDEGKVRYFLVSGSGDGGGMGGSVNSVLFSWVREHCTAVSSEDWSGNSAGSPVQIAQVSPGNSDLTTSRNPGSASSNGGANTLYDCAGYNGQTPL
jgi:4-amino-4-deoxy-L-arabinose transferase-like glycosyltransferase